MKDQAGRDEGLVIPESTPQDERTVLQNKNATLELELREWRNCFLILQGTGIKLIARLDVWIINNQDVLPEKIELAILELASVLHRGPKALRKFLEPVDQAEQTVLSAAMAFGEASRPSGLVERFTDLQEIARAEQVLQAASRALHAERKKTKEQMLSVLEKGNSPDKGVLEGSNETK